jgi:hypothetical protein
VAAHGDEDRQREFWNNDQAIWKRDVVMPGKENNDPQMG